MAKTPAAKASSPDPMKTVADALDKAFKAAKGGTADAKTAVGKALPAAGRFLSRFVYTTSYTFSYGVVFPAVIIAKSIPANNAVVHGFVDGARAASDTVDQWKHRQLEPPAEPPAEPPVELPVELPPSPASKPRPSRARSSKGKPKTAK
ncbi:MAG: hypothetical protein ACHRXM_13685 [Isosphaerales bacterium]